MLTPFIRGEINRKRDLLVSPPSAFGGAAKEHGRVRGAFGYAASEKLALVGIAHHVVVVVIVGTRHCSTDAVHQFQPRYASGSPNVRINRVRPTRIRTRVSGRVRFFSAFRERAAKCFSGCYNKYLRKAGMMYNVDG